MLLGFRYCPQNELVAEQFLTNFHQCTNQTFQVTIKSGSLRKLKLCFLWRITILTPRAKFIKESVFVRRHTLVKKFGILKFDRINMTRYAKNLNLQSTLTENWNHKFKWETLLQAPKNYDQPKDFEAPFIGIMGDQHWVIN